MCTADYDNDCPITDIQIIEDGVNSPIFSDPNYRTEKNKQSPQVGNEMIMWLAITSHTNSRSNSPLQSIQLTYGTPCAFTSDASVYSSSDPEPTFYPLELDAKIEDCRDFSEHSKMTGQAIDTRYMSILTQIRSPTEFEIQKASGVYDQLITMPYYSNYISNPQEAKSNLEYDFLYRPMIFYDP